jgi:hypothetical protein
MSKRSLIKRIFSIGKAGEGLEEGVPAEELAGATGVEASPGGEAAVKPSITEILFRRKGGPEPAEEAPAPSGETVTALLPDRLGDRRLNRKEETAQKLSEGFDDLSGLLKSINQKLEDSNDRGRMLADSIDELPEVLRSIPETNRAQIEFLGTISKQLDLQTVRSGELIEHFRSLPEILKSIPASQQAHAEQLQSIAAQLSENSTRQMGQFQGLQKSQQQALVAFQSTQNKSLNLFHKAQQQSLSMFKGSQAMQSRQIEEFMARTQRSLKWTLVACSLIVSATALGVAAMVFLL